MSFSDDLSMNAGASKGQTGVGLRGDPGQNQGPLQEAQDRQRKISSDYCNHDYDMTALILACSLNEYR